MDEARYDVVVVGAGPAGSLTAKTAADNGLDVLLLERNHEIGVPLKCAEGVSKEVERFVEIEPRWICAAVKGINLYGPDGTKVVISIAGAEELGYVLDRGLFDKYLAQQAARAGADISVKTQVYGLIKDEGYVKGVYAHVAGEPVRIRADIVVGADGVESQVGRWGGINTLLPLADIGICAQFFMCNVDVNKDYYETFFGGDITAKGYAWIFPKGDDCANVGLGIGGAYSGEYHRARDYLNAFVADKYPQGEILAYTYGAVPLSGPVYETVANGLVLVGDAARHVNPVNGGGILQALKGGVIAGEVIAKAIAEKDVSKQRLMEYEERWRRDFGQVLAAGLKMKKIVERLSSHDLAKFFRSFAGEITVSEYSERACMKELIKKNPRVLFHMLRLTF